MLKDIAMENDLNWLAYNYGALTEGEQKLVGVVEKQAQYIELFRELLNKQLEMIELLQSEISDLRSQVSINTCNLRSQGFED